MASFVLNKGGRQGWWQGGWTWLGGSGELEKYLGFGEMPPCSSASLCWSAAGFLALSTSRAAWASQFCKLVIYLVSAPFSECFQ